MGRPLPHVECDFHRLDSMGDAHVSRLGRVLQHPNRDTNDIGLLPRGRDSEHTRHELYLLCQYEVADDRDHAALAIEHRCSRSPVIHDEAIISIVQLEECRAGEPVLCPVLHESAARETQAVIGIRDARHTLVRHERLRPDRKDLCTGNGFLNSSTAILSG